MQVKVAAYLYNSFQLNSTAFGVYKGWKMPSQHMASMPHVSASLSGTPRHDKVHCVIPATRSGTSRSTDSRQVILSHMQHDTIHWS